MRKVIYICYDPLTARIERDWYIGYLVENGIPVEYWDCSAIFFPDQKFTESLDRDYMTKIQSYKDIELRLKRESNPDTAYVMLVVYEFRAFSLYKLLAQHDCKLYFIRWAFFPHKNKISSKIAKLPAHPLKYFGRLLDKIFIMITKKTSYKRPFEKVFYAGAAALPAEGEALKSIPINYQMCDYDSFIFLKNNPKALVKSRYAVFLDINLPRHPDLRLVKTKSVDENEYFRSINMFFELVEKKYGVEVVVAAHPHSNYNDTDFNGRKIIKNETFALVRAAEFVISHHSASMNYAVLNRKPIVYIYTQEMDRLYSDSAMPFIKGCAEFLNAAIYNVDDITDVDQINIQEVDKGRYDAYKYAFLISKETENSLSRDIFLKEITS